MRRGIEVGFDVRTAGSSVELALVLGSSRDARTALRPGSVLLRARLRNTSAGRHAVGVRLRATVASRIRSSGRHRATLRIRVRAPGGRTSTAFRAVTLRY